MICPNCGREIPEGAACPYCGSSASLYSSNPAVNVLKSIGASKLFLCAVICYTVAVVLSLFAASQASSAVEDVLSTMVYSGLIEPEIYYAAMQSASSTSIIGEIFGSAPTILIAVGMWMTFASCRNRTTGNVSTAGLTICRVIAIISLVGLGIAAALIVLLLILVFVAMGVSSSVEPYAVGFILGFVVVIAAALALMLAFYISALRTISRIKTTALTGVPDNRISKFLTGFMIVSAAANFIMAVSALFVTPLAGLGAAASGVCLILLSIALKRYRQQMTLLIYPQMQPPVQGYYPPMQ